MLEQESNKIEEQISLINQQIEELEILKSSLEKLGETKEKEILASFGKGIFFKSELKEKELFVNIGAGIVVRKKPKQTAEIVQQQVAQLEGIKEILMKNIGDIRLQLEALVEQAQKES